MHIHDDEGKPVKMAFSVTAERVNHYNDVIGFMKSTAIRKFVDTHKRQPSAQAVKFYEKEMVRMVTIQRDIKGAEKIRIQDSNILNEKKQN